MNPPRPTPARMRVLEKQLQKSIDYINAMTRGNVKSSDSLRLEYLRNVREELGRGLEWITHISVKDEL